MNWKIAAVLALTGFACSPAAAQIPLAIDAGATEAEGWAVGYNNALQGCLAKATYQDDTTVWIGYSGKLQFYVAFTNPAWRSIEAGKSYAMRIEARGLANWKGTFAGFDHNGERGVINSNLKREFLLDIAATSGIALKLGDKLITRVSMAGSRAALNEMLSCQRSHPDANQSEARTPRSEENRASSGTGFFVSWQGHVMTNAHVADGCKKMSAAAPGDLPLEAKVLAIDKRNDLALLQTNLKPAAVPALRQHVRVGENIAVFGYPLSGLLATTGNFTLGNVTANAGLGDDTSQLQISAPVQPGNSGGPLVDQNGNVVGVIVSKLNALSVAQVTKDLPQNVNFAIKATIAANFLESNGLTPVSTEAKSVLSNADIAEKVKTFTVRVTCN